MTLRLDTPALDSAVRYGELSAADVDTAVAPDALRADAAPDAPRQRSSVGEGERDERAETEADAPQAGAGEVENDAASNLTLHRDQVVARLHARAREGGAAQPDVEGQARDARAEASTTPVRWTEYAMYVTARAAQQQGLVSQAQAQQHLDLSAAVLSLLTRDGAGVLRLAPDGLGALLRAAGIDTGRIGVAHLEGAARFVNGATFAAQQASRLVQTMDVLRTVADGAPPQLSAQEMKEQLKATFGLPDKAFKKMDEGEIRAKYNELMAALEGPAGSHSIKVGKCKVKFTVDGSGNLTECKVKKGGFLGGLFSAVGNFFGKFGKVLLTACSFIPIPWIAIPARIISGVISVVEAVKSGNVLGAVAGVASTVVGGIGAVAGKALSGTLAAVSKVADVTAKAARGLEAGINAARSGNVLGLVDAGLAVAGTVAGAFGSGAQAVYDFASDAREWVNRVMVGQQVLVSIRNGEFVQAATTGVGLAGDVAGEFGGGEGVARAAAEVKTYAGYADDAVGVARNLQHGNLVGALDDAAGLANAIDRTGGSGSSDGDCGAARYLGYASDAIAVGTHVARGEWAQALDTAGTLYGSVTTHHFDAGEAGTDRGWQATVARWLQHGGQVVTAIEAANDGDYAPLFDVAPGVINDIAWDFGSVLGAVPEDGATRETWQAKRQIETWTDRAEVAWRVGGDIAGGRYAEAAHDVLSLTADVAGETGARWVDTVDRYLDVAVDTAQLAVTVASGDLGATLDRAAAVAQRITVMAGDDDAHPGEVRVLRRIGLWMGRGVDAVRLVDSVHAQDYETAVRRGYDVAVDIAASGATGAALREHGDDVIEAGFDLGRAIGSRDVADILRAAAALRTDVREAVEDARLDRLAA